MNVDMNRQADSEMHLYVSSESHLGGYMLRNKIFFRDVESALGPMIAGAGAEGVAFLEWHDRGGVERIKERVIKRYKCELVPGNCEHLDQLEQEVTGYFEGRSRQFNVSIAVTGTAFERRVWESLQQIPYGQTRGYGELANQLGRPGAARAVGRANGANYLSIVIPCHRVIEANGNLRGYGGGLWRKRRLLDLESGQTH